MEPGGLGDDDPRDGVRLAAINLYEFRNLEWRRLDPRPLPSATCEFRPDRNPYASASGRAVRASTIRVARSAGGNPVAFLESTVAGGNILEAGRVDQLGHRPSSIAAIDKHPAQGLQPEAQDVA